MGRASKSLTFCSKSFLCPSGLVKFGQAFLLPFGPWQITHHFRFWRVKRKGTVLPPAAERLKRRSPPASGTCVCRLSIKQEFLFGPYIDQTFRENILCKDSKLGAFYTWESLHCYFPKTLAEGRQTMMLAANSKRAPGSRVCADFGPCLPRPAVALPVPSCARIGSTPQPASEQTSRGFNPCSWIIPSSSSCGERTGSR